MNKSQKAMTAKWVVDVKGEAGSKCFEITVLRDDNEHGKKSFGWIGEISAQAWRNNRQFDKDIWHHYLKLNEMQEEVELKDGTICSKWVETPDGSVAVISTASLSARCFAEYITIIEAFGSGLGVLFSANPKENYR